MKAMILSRRAFLSSVGLTVVGIGVGLVERGASSKKDELVCRHCKSVVRSLVLSQSHGHSVRFCPGCGHEWMARNARNPEWRAQYGVSTKQKRNRARYLHKNIGVCFPNPQLLIKTTKPLGSFENLNF